MSDDTQVSETETDGAGEDQTLIAPSQSTQRTPEEIAEFNLKKAAERARAAGIDPTKVLGATTSEQVSDDDKPLTMKDLRAMQTADAKKSAIEMAESLPEAERDEVKKLLETRIVPSGNADEDLRLARSAVAADHNKQIAEDLARKPDVRRTAAGGSSSASTEAPFEPTESEKVFMAPPYNLSKEQIIAKRPK